MVKDDGLDKTNTPSAAEVTQADRDAASAAYYDCYDSPPNALWMAKMENGDHDDDPLVQAFARHRQQAIAQHEGNEERSITTNDEADGGCVMDVEVTQADTCLICGEALSQHSTATGTPTCRNIAVPTFQSRQQAIAQQAEEVARLREALEYAAMGLRRIHSSLASFGPKQASGEMTAHFLDRALAALNEQPGGEG